MLPLPISKETEAFYKELEAYLKANAIANLDIYIKEDHCIVISNTFYNYTIMQYFIGLLFGLVFLFTVDELKVLGLLLSLICLVRVILNLSPVKTWHIDVANRELKRTGFFFPKSPIPFDQIKRTTIKPSSEDFDLARFELIANLSSGIDIILFDVREEKHARWIAHLFNQLVVKKKPL